MDASEFFLRVVKSNYEKSMSDPNDLRSLWNAVVSMNTVAEYLALDRLGYPKVQLDELNRKAKEIREKSPILIDLKFCAETLKHVRKLQGTSSAAMTLTPSSTGFSPDQPSTWIIDDNSKRYVLPVVLSQAFAKLSAFPEFK